MTPAFVIIAALTLAGAAAAMTLRKLVHCVLALILALAGLAALYLELHAQFLGLTQVLVYIGAIAILIVFAILLTHGEDEASPPGSAQGASRFLSVSLSLVAGGAIAAAVFAVLAWAINAGGFAGLPAPPAPAAATRQIGDALMGRFVLPLEVTGLMLTAALIGAVILALEEKRDAK